MGYDSTFSGSLSPSKPIPEELIERINDACDLKVASIHDDCDGEPGDVIPQSRTMHGYNMAEDAYKVQALLRQNGITLNGTIYRVGEESDDYEMIEVVKGNVYTRTGAVVYGNRNPITAKDVTDYAIRVLSPDRRKHIGWIGEKGLLDKDYPVVEPKAPDGNPDFDKPPYEALTMPDKKKARALVKRLNRKKGGNFHELVELVDKL